MLIQFKRIQILTSQLELEFFAKLKEFSAKLKNQAKKIPAGRWPIVEKTNQL